MEELELERREGMEDELPPCHCGDAFSAFSTFQSNSSHSFNLLSTFLTQNHEQIMKHFTINNPTTIDYRMDLLCVEVGIISQPLCLLHVDLLLVSKTSLTINPTIHECPITLMEHTGIFQHGQAGGSCLLNSTLIHFVLLPQLALILARAGNHLDRNKVL
jgi:hypothetical protein